MRLGMGASACCEEFRIGPAFRAATPATRVPSDEAGTVQQRHDLGSRAWIRPAQAQH